MQYTCPHCDQAAKIRTSRKITELTREYYVQCENVECFHAWVVIASGVRTLQPSLNPNPLVYVPSRSPTLQAPSVCIFRSFVSVNILLLLVKIPSEVPSISSGNSDSLR